MKLVNLVINEKNEPAREVEQFVLERTSGADEENNDLYRGKEKTNLVVQPFQYTKWEIPVYQGGKR